MLLVGFRGLAVDANHPIVQDIRRRNLGAVVLFDYDVPNRSPVRNIQSPQQLTGLVSSLQSFSATPVIVATDEEGGEIARLNPRDGFPATVSAQELGSKNDVTLTYRHASAIARMLRETGINLNLAPVVDLDVNPSNPIIGKLGRSFSADPQVVTRNALEFIRAHHDLGVLCTLKHFPGHGSSAQDSHLGFVDVTNTWSRAELEPFANVIAAGQADAVMTAHIFNAKLDPQYPATLSERIIGGVLRGQLKYSGVVISDDMQMGAISAHYGLETAVERAILAGVDILSFANNSVFEEDIVARVTDLIRRLVGEGRISEGRIDESYRRIRALKARIRI